MKLLPVVIALLTAAAAPADPALRELLDTPDEVAFIGGFCSLLQQTPAAEMPTFRQQLAAGLRDDSLPGRHAWRALTLTDTRWLETDAPGFLAACQAGLKDVSWNCQLAALRRLMDQDLATALQIFRQLHVAQNPDQTESFLVALTAKNPPAAIALLKEQPVSVSSPQWAEAVIKAWAALDADAAWAGLAGLPTYAKESQTPSEIGRRRGLVCAAAADPLRLIATLATPEERAEAAACALRQCHGESGLAIARAIDTPEIWAAWASVARLGTPDETLRRLLEVLPPAHRNAGLTAFFTVDRQPYHPAFHHAPLIGLLPDPALRQAMILAITAKRPDYQALPLAVVDAALAALPGILAAPTPPALRKRLLVAIARRNPEPLIPALLAMPMVDLNDDEGAICAAWPTARLTADFHRLLTDPNPQAAVLGKRLGERLWHADPVAAFPHLVEESSDTIEWSLSSYLPKFFAHCGGDVDRLAALLGAVREPAQRQRVLDVLTLWRCQTLPPKEAFEIYLQFLARHPGGKLDHIGWPYEIARRPEPEFDALIAAMPDDLTCHRDPLLGLRMEKHLLDGDQPAGLAAWRAIRNDAVFTNTLSRILTEDAETVHLTAWEDWFAAAAERPASDNRSHTLRNLAYRMTRSHWDQALALAQTDPAEDVRAALTDAIKNSGGNPATAPNWYQAVELGLATEPGRRMGIKALTRLARTDPSAAIACLLKTGETALRPEFLEPILRELASRDPAKAFATAARLPAETQPDFLSYAATEWAKSDPAATAAACVKIADPKLRRRVIDHLPLDRWLTLDAAATLAWIDTLPDSESRADCLNRVIRSLNETDPYHAAKLLLATAAPDANRIAETAASLGRRSYVTACRFLIQAAAVVPPEKLHLSWKTLLTAWHQQDPGSAAAFLANPGQFPIPAALDQNASTQVQSPPQPPPAPPPAPDVAAAAAAMPESPAHTIVLHALLEQDPAAALRAAVTLSGPDADTLVCRILAAFPTPAAARAAIEALPDPATRARATAWLDRL